MRLVETFYSIQGESTYSGKPCFFIRCFGCNLSCVMCDTLYAKQEPYLEMPLQDILTVALESPAPIVEITGGEPLLQSDEVVSLCQELVKHKTVLIETNGTVSIEPFRHAPKNLVLVMDIKTPSSGMHEFEHLWRANVQHLRKVDQIKFVVGDRTDFDYSLQQIKDFSLQKRVREIIISPVFNTVSLQSLAQWVLQELPFARMQVQLHKIIYGVEARGV